MLIINPDLNGILNNHLGMEPYIKKKCNEIKSNIPIPFHDSFNLEESMIKAMHNFNLINHKQYHDV